MLRHNLIPLLVSVMIVAFGVAGAAEASIALNSSRSNIYKTAANCTKAGGIWGNGRDGIGCYMPAKR
jgi:hypothetical protein